jgi:putative heme iron utilization protein
VKELALLSLLAAAPALHAHEQADVLHCASQADTQRVRDYYTGYRPGVPLPVPSRFLDVPEMVIASGLPAEQSIGTPGSPRIVKDIWKSIDAWGEKTAVKLVLTSGGKHAYAFPSLVPITQPEDKSGYLDVYADGGKGVHAHIQVAHVKAVYATDIPGKEAARRTRAISFFGADGQLILGVYASIAAENADPAAVAGFAKTWELIRSLPRACAAP